MKNDPIIINKNHVEDVSKRVITTNDLHEEIKHIRLCFNNPNDPTKFVEITTNTFHMTYVNIFYYSRSNNGNVFLESDKSFLPNTLPKKWKPIIEWINENFEIYEKKFSSKGYYEMIIVNLQQLKDNQ